MAEQLDLFPDLDADTLMQTTCPVEDLRFPPEVACLRIAERLITVDRNKVYGDAEDNFDVIAELLAPIIGKTLTRWQVALVMNQIKVARLCFSPAHDDSWIDLCGYAALGRRVAKS